MAHRQTCSGDEQRRCLYLQVDQGPAMGTYRGFDRLWWANVEVGESRVRRWVCMRRPFRDAQHVFSRSIRLEKQCRSIGPDTLRP